MKKNKIESSIKMKRTKYLLGIIEEYKYIKSSDEISDCYEYVKKEYERTIDIFLETLSQDETNLIEKDLSRYFEPIQSLDFFEMFLTNNNVALS